MAIAVVLIMIEFTGDAPHTFASRFVMRLIAATAMAVAAAWWCGPWPSRWWSIAFLVYADIAIVTSSAMQTNRLVALLWLNLLSLVALYVKFFDGPKILALHTIWALISIGAIAALWSAEAPRDGLLVGVAAVVAALSVASTPMIVHFGLWVLRSDAHDSLTDELTGLLNRRGLNLRFARLSDDRRLTAPTGAVVMVMVIDIDHFKRINDTYGHAVGDQVLVRSARNIAGVVRSDAHVARVGGDEFVIVDVVAPHEVRAISEWIAAAVGSFDDIPPVTASIGLATIAAADITDNHSDPLRILNAAIDCADHAMFAAKRHGSRATTDHNQSLQDRAVPWVCDCTVTTSDCDNPDADDQWQIADCGGV